MKQEDSNMNLYEYLYNNSSNPYCIELLQYEINSRIYYFGNNFASPKERKISVKERSINFLSYLYRKVKTKSIKKSNNLIISNAYFSVNDEIKKNGFEVAIPWWTIKKGGSYIKHQKIEKLFNEINGSLKNDTIPDLISETFINKIILFKKLLKDFIEPTEIKAIILSNDLGFFERVFIDAFKEKEILTFIYLHGLPARYNYIDDNRADYLIVWGDKIKNNYINAGVDGNKIIVAGHPFYNSNKFSKIQFNLNDVLVISKTKCGTPLSSDNVILSDRGNCLIYLEMIKEVLFSYGVKKVRLRLHPSESENWYSNNIDNVFFELDNNSLKDSLKNTSMVIGPTSTVFLESIYAGVNYLIFEPQEDGLDILKNKVVDPFDGVNNNLPVAKSVKELSCLIRDKKTVSGQILKDYFTEKFDMTKVFEKIN